MLPWRSWGGSLGGLRGAGHENLIKYKGLKGVLGPTTLSDPVEAFWLGYFRGPNHPLGSMEVNLYAKHTSEHVS